jgi:transcriptional regulator with XRE-family HTH domain
MSKPSAALASLPPIVSKTLVQFGENLAIARIRRKESQRVWSRRLNVSIPTLIRMERGDPKVSLGVYATALWMIGQIKALSDLIDPQRDLGALELDVRAATKRRTIRSASSIEERLGRPPVKRKSLAK